MRRFVHEITSADVGRALLSIGGRQYPVSSFMGRILKGDVGKRIFLVGGVLQVENDEQRAKRRPPMSTVQPGCYGYCGRKAAAGRMFCSARCGALYAEELVRGNEEHWCPVCQHWSGAPSYSDKLVCGHARTELVEGTTAKGAAAMCKAAVGT